MRLTVSLLLALVASLVVASITWGYRRGDPQADIQPVAAILLQLEQRHKEMSQPPTLPFTADDFIEPPRLWTELDTVAASLSTHNRAVARAKALALLEKRPDAVSPDEWRVRFELSERVFQPYDSAMRRVVRSVFACSAVFIVTIAVGWILLPVVSAAWHFILSRVRELSRAVRGVSE